MPLLSRLFPSCFDRRHFLAFGILLAGALIPAWTAGLWIPPPQNREIHIEAFRYGFHPSRIHVQRGDRLRLTFSTRDTGQSFFLPDYDLHVVITPGSSSVEVHRLSRPEDPAVLLSEVELIAGITGPMGWMFSKSQFRNHTYNGPLHGTERGDLIVGPNYCLIGSLGLLSMLPLAGWLLLGTGSVQKPGSGTIDLFQLIPWLKRRMKGPAFQFHLALPMLAFFYFLILAGWIGTKVSGRNAGPMVIWMVWLPILILLLVPLGGRIWCLLCPIPLLGEWVRKHAVPGFSLRWPAWLDGPWLRLLLFLLLGTFSTALVATPPATSWLLVGLTLAALAGSVFQEPRIFCRHLCPVNSFISLYSMTGRLMVRSVSASTCAVCSARSCLNGNADSLGCPYGLCTAEVYRNNDCGMCAECVRTCSYDNVAFFWRRRGWDTGIASYGEAWQAIVMFGLAVFYSIVQLGPWHRLRDWMDIIDRQNWSSFWSFSAALWVVCLLVLPGLFYTAIWAGLRIIRSPLSPGSLFRSCSAAFVPLGLSCWMAFALAMLLSMLTFVLQSLSDPFNWGWDLFGTAGSRWHIFGAPAIPWMQVLCIIIGFIYSLRMLIDCRQQHLPGRHHAIRGALPSVLFFWMTAAGLLYFYAG